MYKTYYEMTLKPCPYSCYLALLNFVVYDLGYDVEEDSGVLIVRDGSSLDRLKDMCYAFVEILKVSSNMSDAVVLEVAIAQKESIDWVKSYQDGIKPVVVGGFFIRASWIEHNNNYINIVIDPSLAFGTGSHETTNACIKSLIKYVKKDQRVLDVGCGSGILGLVSSKLGACVDMCDSDELAIKTSKKNFRMNNVSYNSCFLGTVKSFKESLEDDCSQLIKYDVVVSNIVADVLISIKDDLHGFLNLDGYLILSGILCEHEEYLMGEFVELEGLTLEERVLQNEWVTLVFKRQTL